MDLFRFIPGYETGIYQAGREPAFVMLLAFLITFLIARGYTRIARIRGWGSTFVGDVHMHHLVVGLVLSFSAAALEFGYLPSPGVIQLLLSAVFGCGAALVLDEFALIFHLQDVYWESEGRKSVDAIIIATVFGVLFLIHITPLGTSSANEPMWIISIGIFINILLVIATALKGKIFMAIFGIFIPVLTVIGTIRLAKPNSIWARRFYKPKSKKSQRAVRRYEHYKKRWKPIKEKMLDIIGGKTGRPTLGS